MTRREDSVLGKASCDDRETCNIQLKILTDMICASKSMARMESSHITLGSSRSDDENKENGVFKIVEDSGLIFGVTRSADGIADGNLARGDVVIVVVVDF